MKSKDQMLLEEAYELVQLNEGVIPSFISNKLKEVVSTLVQKAFEEDPEEINKLIEAIKNKDVDSLKSMFVKHNTERMVKQHLDLPTASPVHEEGLWSGIKTVWNGFANFLADIGDMVYGKPGETHAIQYLALILSILMGMAVMISLPTTGGALIGIPALADLTLPLSVACGIMIPFLVASNSRQTLDNNPNKNRKFGEKR